MRGLWYLVTLTAATVWYGGRTILASWRGIPWQRGGVYDREEQGWGASLLKTNGITMVPVGLDRFDHEKPYVFASNHTSIVDIWAILAIVPGSVRFVAKQELFKIPVLGRAMRSAGHIFIDRRKMKSAFGAYEEAGASIRGGISAAVFPEGTRSPDGTLLPFKRGPFVLAIQAGVPIVPVFVTDGWKAIRPGSMKVRPQTLEIRFGDPISTAGLTAADRDTLAELTRNAVEQLRDPVDAPSRAR